MLKRNFINYIKKIKSLENQKKTPNISQLTLGLAKFYKYFIPEEHKVK